LTSPCFEDHRCVFNVALHRFRYAGKDWLHLTAPFMR
jgi:hypothetical protein